MNPAKQILSAGIFAILVLVYPPDPRAQARQAVDLELVLAIDVSTSVDATEFALQRRGLSQAFLHPDVVGAVRAAGDLGIAVALIQWSGQGRQSLSVDWSLVTDTESATDFANRVAASPRSIEGMTAIGDAIDFSIAALATNSFQGRRLVIDVSGDGTGNAARSAAARNRAVARGITVNGLVIDNEDIDLGELAKLDVRAHYSNHVIGGFGAFLMNATDFTDFKTVIRRKLVREIIGPATASLSESNARQCNLIEPDLVELSLHALLVDHEFGRSQSKKAITAGR